MEIKNEILIKRFFAEKSNSYGESLSDKTQIAYLNDIKQFLTFVDKDIVDVEKNDVSAYYGYLRGQYTGASISRKINSLKSFYKWLFEIDLIKENPVVLKSVKIKNKEKIALTSAEVNAIIKESKPQLKLIVKILANTGLRVSELINLNIDDINFYNGEVKILGKGNKIRYIYLNKALLDDVSEFIKNVRDNTTTLKNLFISKNKTILKEITINKALKRVAKKVGITDYERVSPHLFRTTYASMLNEKNVPIPTIQKVLGHSNIATTMVYIKVNNQQVADTMQDFSIE